MAALALTENNHGSRKETREKLDILKEMCSKL